ncbi:4-hydroxy-tetrahydrodipicolinate synthase [Sediminibacillus halophilus]|uniref:4-hydroxy-tetrahydrodipicolinate synthase n=1 Tax=Sediminibacillus halophilus TaxID=482461 RepID=A0A1G9MF12_9BACI|nr:4-hydroxy-tetrahydrodipicolinate synthase [Sediminibacillus halophilus]SDL72507.1 4-hydroxy-tetrahydrodipicolinate synthase [Sediminibacillus halophilus]
MNFGRVLTAMVTPFDNKGNIDLEKTTELVNYLLNNGSDGLVISGTTGESPTLTQEEKIAVFKRVVKDVNKRVPVIAGTGSNNTYATIEFTKKAEKAGVDAALLVVPYYNKPNQRGIYEHFAAVARETTLPIMLYNIPGRSVVRMDPETVIELAKIPNIVSIKDSTGDLDAISTIIENTSDTFTVYSGDDSLTLPITAVGGNGIVSVSSHVIGKEMQEMLTAFEAGETAKASKLHRQLLPIMKGMFMAPSPTPVKTALQIKGMDVGGVRLPLVPLTGEERNQLTQLLSGK